MKQFGDITATNAIRGQAAVIAGAATGVGTVAMIAGDATHAGFVEWRAAPTGGATFGTRIGFLGYVATDIYLALENGAGFNVMGGSVRVGTVTDLGVNAKQQTLYAGGSSQYGAAYRPGADTTTVLQFQNAAGTQIGTISQSASAVSFNTSSDGRIKPVASRKDLEPGDLFDRLRPMRYLMTVGPQPQPGVGFIAQELAVDVPEAVLAGDNSSELDPTDPGFRMWSVDLSKLIPFVAAELKSLRARLKAVEGRQGRTTVAITPGALTVGTRAYVVSCKGVRVGDSLVANPVTPLPANMLLAAVRVPEADAVEITLGALLAVTAATPISFTLAVSR